MLYAAEESSTFPMGNNSTRKNAVFSQYDLIHRSQMIEFIHESFFDFSSLSKIDQSFFSRFLSISQ